MDKAKHHSHSSSKDSGRPYGSNGENAYVTPPASATPGRSFDNQAQNDSSRMSIDSPGKYSCFLYFFFISTCSRFLDAGDVYNTLFYCISLTFHTTLLPAHFHLSRHLIMEGAKTLVTSLNHAILQATAIPENRSNHSTPANGSAFSF